MIALQKGMGITLPEEATVINAEHDHSAFDSSGLLQFTLPRSRLDPFLSSPRFDGLSLSASERRIEDYYYKNSSEWRPSNAVNFRSGLLCETSHELCILIDLDDPHTAIVYLYGSW